MTECDQIRMAADDFGRLYYRFVEQYFVMD